MGLLKRQSVPRNRQGAINSRTVRKPESTMVIGYGDTVKGTMARQDNIFIRVIGKVRVRTEFDNLHCIAGHDTEKQEQEQEYGKRAGKRHGIFPFYNQEI